MAALSTFAQRRKKQTTYGKASRHANTWNVNSFDASDDDELSAPKVTVPRRPNVKETYPVQKRETNPHALKAIKARAKKEDAWDVPSSDEEVGSTISQRSPPKALLKRKLVNVEPEKAVELAPWERKKAGTSQTAPAGGSAWEKRASAAADAQLRLEIAGAVPNEKKIVRSVEGSAAVSPVKHLFSPGDSGSAARLKARKLLAGHSMTSRTSELPQQEQVPRIQKRTDNDNAESDPAPRKRLKKTDARENNDSEDIVMEEIPTPSCQSSSPAPSKSPKAAAETDVYNLPNSDDESSENYKLLVADRKPAQQNLRRGKLKATARSSPRTMESAPARLREMLPMDTDSSGTSRPVTPHKPVETNMDATPGTAFKSDNATVLHQTHPLNQLVPEELSAPSPSSLPMQSLTLKSARKTSTKITASARMLTKSSSDLGPSRRRTKLVDRLKASAPSSDIESSDVDNEDEDDDSEDVQMSSDEPPEEQSTSLHQSQSQSQSQSISIDAGPKITYGRTRSYLPEDSFEEGLMLGIDLPQPTTTAGLHRSTIKSNPDSQQSAFDFDESEDDDAGGKMRTVHELRVGGGNQRFMDETRGLLDDIADRSVSARSRRRSALIEVAEKLKDKTFAERFYGQGFERYILAECEASTDEIADFILAAAFATMLSGEPPEHVAGSFRDGGILSWAMRLVESRSDPTKMTKDRRNNMAKAVQSAFIDFAAGVASQHTIWPDLKPAILTPRILALKVAEQVITRVRRTGDRSDLIGTNDARKIAPSEKDIHELGNGNSSIDVSLPISVLECLYANAATLAWPIDITERVSAILTKPTIANDKKQYLRFLTQRLCTYVTTDSTRNCKAFSKSPTVLYLLRAIGEGFLKHYEALEQEEHEMNFALLVSDIGVMINLTLHGENAREHVATEEAKPLLNNIVNVFQDGQKRMLEAVSEEDTQTNVAYGYLAVLLANLCRNRRAKQMIASQLPGKNLNALIAAMQEFLAHNQKVDTLGSNDEQNVEVEGWSVFTEKLKRILERLIVDAQIDMGV